MIFVHARSQSARVNNANPKSSKVITGAPQSSVMTHICSVSDNHIVNITIFADDIKLYSSIDISADRFSLQNHLHLIYKWLLDWQLASQLNA